MHRALAPAIAAALALTPFVRGDRLLAQSPSETNTNAAAMADAPAKTFPCPNNQLTDDQKKRLGAKFLQAWICRTSGVFWHPLFSKELPPNWQKPFRPLDLNGYGCYCGSGSTGLDTTPVDGYDECCRQHDIDWTAICRNIEDPDKPGTGCDCYVNVPFGTDCNNNKLIFPAPDPANPCKEKCGEELNKQFDCYATVHANTRTPPDLTKYRNQCMWEHFPNPVDNPPIGNVGPGSPFQVVPSYCKKSAVPIPPSTFGPVDAGTNVYATCGCWLDTPDCSSYVMGCARSAESCQAMGGTPAVDCCAAGGCNVDVTARACPYRNPDDPCQRFSCPFGATEGDPCDPLTGRAGEGGTCWLVDEDLFLCFPNLPAIGDLRTDVESFAATPICAVEATAARSPQD